MFGDAAGAAVFSRSSNELMTNQEMRDSNIPAIFSSHMHADGNLSELLVLPAGGSKLPFSQEVLDNGDQYMRMQGREIFRNAVRAMAQSCQEALDANGMNKDQIDWVIPHQANTRIIDAVANHFDIPKEKVIYHIKTTGNTSAATVPTALDAAVSDGRIQRGQTILLTAFGGGLTSGSVIMRF